MQTLFKLFKRRLQALLVPAGSKDTSNGGTMPGRKMVDKPLYSFDEIMEIMFETHETKRLIELLDVVVDDKKKYSLYELETMVALIRFKIALTV